MRTFGIAIVFLLTATLAVRPFASVATSFAASKPVNAKNDDDKDSDEDKDSDSKDDKSKDKDKSHDKGDKKKDEKGWEKVKSFAGRAKAKDKACKFLVTTKEWRMTFSSEPAETDAKNPKVRAALFVEVLRDQDGEPKNWKQLDVLYDGDAGGGGTKVFSNGLGNDGKPKWFQIIIAGQMSKYHILVEDHGEKRSSK
jgi:hypothetical protein